MAEIKSFRDLFDRIPVYGDSGFARAAALHDSANFKVKNTSLRRAGRAGAFGDRWQTVLAPDLSPRKAFSDRF